MTYEQKTLELPGWFVPVNLQHGGYMKSDSGKSKKDKKGNVSENCYYDWIATTEKKIYDAWIKKD